MGNPVDYAISRVLNADISEYLFELAFANKNANVLGNWYNLVNETTIEQGIREKIIHQLILKDCNVAGGKTEYLDLGGSEMRSIGNGCVEVRVPEMTTRGAKIISVTECYLGSMNSAIGQLGVGVGNDAECGSGVVNEMMGSMINNLAGNKSMPQTYTDCQMTGNNIFVIFGLNMGTFNMSGKVIMEYDEGLSSIHARHYPQFAELVELGVKAFIYRKLKSPVNEAAVKMGVALSDVKDDIAEYKDAWSSYKDYFLKTWVPCMTWSDKQNVHDAQRMGVARRT
ncbi:MAG: hypothetical protein KGZ81_12400 [Flavobacteriales bacterium]|nr:hypothetical protein [Flavobacteriales bacterium]